MMEEQKEIRVKPDNNMILAIFTTVCCCLPLGVVAIVKANSVNNLFLMQQYEAAEQAANDAKKWSLWGIGISVVGYLIYFLFLGGIAAIGVLAGS